MTDDNKPPMFAPSFVIDPANHEPRSGKSALMNHWRARRAWPKQSSLIPRLTAH